MQIFIKRKKMISLLLAIVMVLGMLPSSAYADAGDATPEEHIHSWGDGTVTSAAACDEAGSMIHTCTVCGLEESVVVPATGHNWDSGTVTVPASCTTEGSVTYTCTVCGAVKTEAISALGHSFPEWTVIASPTCTETGERTRACATCGTVETEVVPALGHSFPEWTVITPATCTEAGERTRTCAACGTVETEVVSALGHSFPEWTVITPATCTEAGERTRTCAACGAVETEVVPAIGHVWSEWETARESTCAEPGEKKRSCKECKLTETEELPLAEHKWGEWEVTAEPTCTEEGVQTRICAVCKGTETGSVPAKGHVWDAEDERDAATCTVCGEKREDTYIYDIICNGVYWRMAGNDKLVEKPEFWNRMFKDTVYTRDWAQDLLTIASSQIGYHGQSDNYLKNKAGVVRYYTRYGDWFGDSCEYVYGDWCAMFVSFCLYYARIPVSSMPWESSCVRWVRDLKDLGIYADKESYIPEPGDLIFFDYPDPDLNWEPDGNSDHVGIVLTVDEENGIVTTIEGAVNNEVATHRYELGDRSIMGYAKLPENPELAEEDTEYPEFTYNTTVDGMNVSIAAPEGAFPKDTTVTVTGVEAEEVISAVETAVAGSAGSDANVVEKKVVTVKAVDITFRNKEGDEIQPLIPISVVFAPVEKTGETAEVALVHIDNEGVGTLVEDVEQSGEELSFSADSFSTYVYTSVIVTRVIDKTGDTWKISVAFESGTVPDDATLSAEEILEDSENYQEYYDRAAAALAEEDRDLKSVRFFDISILSDGEKIQPKASVTVSIELEEKLGDHLAVLHMSDSDELITPLTPSSSADLAVTGAKSEPEAEKETVSFTANGFSVYGVATFTASSLSELDGNSYLVANSRGTDTWNYFTNSVSGGNIGKTANYNQAALYTFTQSDSNTFYISTDVGGETKYVRIAEDGKLSLADESDRTAFTVEADSGVFRVFYQSSDDAPKYFLTYTDQGFTGKVRTYADDEPLVNLVFKETVDLDGKTYGLINTKDGNDPYGVAMMAEAKDASKLKGLTTKVKINTINRVDYVYVAEASEITEWIFEKVSGSADIYNIKANVNGTLKYLKISESGVSVVEEKDAGCEIKAEYDSSTNKFRFSNQNGTLKLNKSAGTFEKAANNQTGNDVWMSLAEMLTLHDDDFRVYTAAKVSVSGTVVDEPTETSTLLDDGTYIEYDVNDGDQVILYTRIWNGSKYDYYVVDYDGMLIRAYEKGDTLSWVGSKTNTMLWTFTELTKTATVNGNTETVPSYNYYLVNDTRTPQINYISPQSTDDPENAREFLSSNAVRLNLNGRYNKEYYSTLVAWDYDNAVYASIFVDEDYADRQHAMRSAPLSYASDFYFAKAVITPDDAEQTVTPVSTVDNDQFGITLKMQNYSNVNSSNRSQTQVNVLGNTTYVQWSGTKNLVEKYMTGDYPQVAERNHTTHNLQELYSDTITVNQAFLSGTYNETGYFEYDSTKNFAHLIWADDDPWIGVPRPGGGTYQKGDFVVYDELGTSTEKNKPTLEHGQFFPYNDLADTVEYDEETDEYVITPKYPIADYVNDKDIHAVDLSSLDPNNGTAMYGIPQKQGKDATEGYVDHFFGMEMTATFMQSESGKDAWGHDLIFEFSGDDDFWLYVDGVKVLDLGGIHSALDASINFATGQVVEQTGNGQYEKTNLRARFRAAYLEEHPNASNTEVNTWLNEIFEDDGSNTGTVFKDFSSHTMRMFYMERGAGASNLRMRFNLASYKKGEVLLEKEVEGSDNYKGKFPFQIYYNNPIYSYLDASNNHVDGNGSPLLPGDSTNTPVFDVINPVIVGDPVYDLMYDTDYDGVLDTGVVVRDKDGKRIYPSDYTVDGITYKNVFWLSPKETVSVNFGREDIEYYIKECATNTDVFTGVYLNDLDHEITGVDTVPVSNTLKDYPISEALVSQRKKVKYINEINSDAVKTLKITKRLWVDEIGGTEITNDNSSFSVRVYVGKDAEDNYIWYSQGDYCIKDSQGRICYYDNATDSYIPFTSHHIQYYDDSHVLQEKDIVYGTDDDPYVYDHSKLDDTPPYPSLKSDKVKGIIQSGRQGDIDNLKPGYSIEIWDVTYDTPFKVEERSDMIPAGYELLGYTTTDGPYDAAHAGDYSEDIFTNEGTLDKDIPDHTVSVHNRNGFGVTVEKTWSDAEFMQSHDDIYFAIYIHDAQGAVTLDGESYSLLDESVRFLPGDKTSLNWFFPDLAGKTLNDYVVFEVALEGDSIEKNEETGAVTGYTGIVPKEAGETIEVGAGTPGPSGYSDSYIYTVTYSRPTEDLSDARTRTDGVTNSRPGIKIIKTDLDGNLLNGATFTMSKILGVEKTFVSGVSGEDGLIMEAYLDSGTSLDPQSSDAAPTYLLAEVGTPSGYQALISKISIRVIRNTDGSQTVYINPDPSDHHNSDPAEDFSTADHESGYYTITAVGDDGYPVITVKNKKYTLQAVKVDAYSNSPMEGVKFELYGSTNDSVTGAEMPQYEPVEFEGGQTILVTDSNGVIPKIVMRSEEHPDGLIPGIYYLREYETPAAYQPLGVYIRIRISETGEISLGSAEKHIEGGTSSWIISEQISEDIASAFFESDTQTMRITVKNIPRESIRIIKKSEDTEELMAGVHFRYYKGSQVDEHGNPIEGETPIFEGDTGDGDNLGILILPAVEDNTTYYLFETSTWDGYNLLPGPVVITSAVQDDGSTKITAKIGNKTLTPVKKTEGGIEVWEITVLNSLGRELPVTGGKGTLAFTFGGAVLAAGSALMLSTEFRRRKRRGRKQNE